MENVMVDLETLGLRAGCSILSIGAVAFEPSTHTLGPELYAVVNRDSCAQVGLHEDPETVDWWTKQAAEAACVVHQSTTGGLSLGVALDTLDKYLAQFDLDRIKVWGNGSDFDNAILIECYAVLGRTEPWQFWNNRCYRTLKNLRPQIKKVRQGVYHNALDDAKSQATHALQLFAALTNA